MKKKNVIRILIGTALILLVPLVSMQFSDEIDWKLSDFVIIGALLIGTGFIYELVAAKIKPQYRIIVAFVCVAAVLLIWAELAAGLFGTPFAGS